VQGESIAFMRSAEGGKEIINFLDANGASVTNIAVYTVKERDPAELKARFDALVAFKPDYVIFTSSLTFTILFTAANALKREKEIFEGVKIAAIGDLTAETITKTGLNVDLVAGTSTFEAVLIELKNEFKGE
jgi:uroporphyrinogen III methyltransferase/synthase